MRVNCIYIYIYINLITSMARTRMAQGWLVYHGCFELFFQSLQNSSNSQENKYLGIFSYFIMELYVVCTH